MPQVAIGGVIIEDSKILLVKRNGAPRAKPVVPPQEYPPTPLGAEALPPSRSPLRRA
jgi:hypothetical protein